MKNKRPKNHGGFMAYFNVKNDCIELVQDNVVIKTFRIVENGTPLATVDWTKKDGKTHLTIKTLDKNASFVVSADEHGYSYQHFLFSQPTGKHIFVSHNPDNPNQQKIQEFEYNHGIQVAHKISEYDTERGVWNIYSGQRQKNGDYILKCFCEIENKKSKTAYYIFDDKGHKKEEGFINTDGKKDGCMTTYDDKGNAVHTYYDNGKKLSLAQRIFHFKRKVSSRTPSQHVSQNELTR